MKVILRNGLGLLLGLFIGHTLNFYLIQLGYKVLPIEGVDPNNFEELKRVMPTLSSKHFIFPFLAHAIGAFIGALITSLIAKSHKMKLAFCVGFVFLIGGILAAYLIPAPTWYVIVDLLLAYLPMAWIAGKIASRKK